MGAIKIKKIVSFFCIFFLLYNSSLTPIFANTLSTQEEIADLEKEQQDLQDKISGIDSDIEDEEAKQEVYLQEMSNVRVQIELYDDQISEANKDIEDFEEQIEELNSEIEDTNGEIEAKQEEITQKQTELEEVNEKFKDRLSAMYMSSGSLSILNAILGADSFSDYLSQSQALENISDNDQALMDELEECKAELQALEEELETYKSELKDSKEEVESKKSAAEDKKIELKTLQNEQQSKADELDSLQTKSEALVESLNLDKKSIQTNIEQIEIDIENAEATIEEITQDNESSSGSSSGSTSSSGWAFPLASYSYISTYYGVSDAWHTTHTHAGVDFAAASGTSIYATRGGTVLLAGWNGGYGYCVMIDHGDGMYSLYAHCSSLAVSYGQSVLQGETIAYVGSTGNSTGPHLHFEIRNGSSTVDPLNYIEV